MRSIASSMPRISVTSPRVSSRVSQPAGIPSTASVARVITSARIRLEFAASDPPLSSTALPDFRHSAAIWTSASGRDSKMTPTTPMGTVTRNNSRPWSSSVARCVCQSGSGWPATERTMSRAVSNLPLRRSRRATRGSLISPLAASVVAASQSRVLAAMMSSRSDTIAAAIASNAASRTDGSVAASFRAASRAPSARLRRTLSDAVVSVFAVVISALPFRLR